MKIVEKMESSVKHWYAPLLSGIILFGAGILAFVFGKTTFLTLAVLFCLAFILSGILDIVFSITNRQKVKHWVWLLALGIINIVFGLLLVANPWVTLKALALFVGCAILFRSIGGIILSIKLKKTNYSKWDYLLALSILGIISAILLMIFPLITGMLAVVFTGIALIAGGIFSMGLSLLLRKLMLVKKEIDKERMKEDMLSWFRE